VISPAKALENTRAANEAKLVAAAKERDEQKVQRAKEEEYVRKVSFPDFVAIVEGAIIKASKEGESKVTIECPSTNWRGNLLCDLMLPILAANKYRAHKKYTYVDAYGGSSDDGHAYAHDAYTAYDLEVSWTT
jgi:hypothetical protein